MGYVEKLLGKDEKIIFETRRHVFVLLGRAFKELLLLVVVVVGFVVVRQWNPPQIELFEIGFLIVLLVVFVSIMIDALAWMNDRLTLTTRRVIHSTGTFSKKVLDSSLGKINDVVMEQSWLGRMFDYGTIKILTASDEVVNSLDRLAHPLKFKQAMLDAKARLENHGTVAAVSSASATQLLEELIQLKQRNLITESEYEAKRQEILKRM
ncbi:MAG TPA: PH domain-containing protein [Acidobacteriota bacterium]|nr:PH domain-containing protein [Acidobacteriota bacterium]